MAQYTDYSAGTTTHARAVASRRAETLRFQLISGVLAASATLIAAGMILQRLMAA